MNLWDYLAANLTAHVQDLNNILSRQHPVLDTAASQNSTRMLLRQALGNRIVHIGRTDPRIQVHLGHLMCDSPWAMRVAYQAEISFSGFPRTEVRVDVSKCISMMILHSSLGTDAQTYEGNQVYTTREDLHSGGVFRQQMLGNWSVPPEARRPEQFTQIPSPSTDEWLRSHRVAAAMGIHQEYQQPGRPVREKGREKIAAEMRRGEEEKKKEEEEFDKKLEEVGLTRIVEFD